MWGPHSIQWIMSIPDTISPLLPSHFPLVSIFRDCPFYKSDCTVASTSWAGFAAVGWMDGVLSDRCLRNPQFISLPLSAQRGCMGLILVFDPEFYTIIDRPSRLLLMEGTNCRSLGLPHEEKNAPPNFPPAICNPHPVEPQLFPFQSSHFTSKDPHSRWDCSAHLPNWESLGKDCLEFLQNSLPRHVQFPFWIAAWGKLVYSYSDPFPNTRVHHLRCVKLLSRSGIWTSSTGLPGK